MILRHLKALGALTLLSFFSVSCLISYSAQAWALDPEARAALDLSAYRVLDPKAGYFDVDARRAVLRNSHSDVLRQAIEDVSDEVTSCVAAKNIPMVDFKLRMPAYYSEREAWREAIRPLFAFEDAVSGLAAAFLALDDPYYGRCLIELLDQWAAVDALSEFHYSSDDRQAWYNIEDMIFSTALAYSIVKGRIEGVRTEELHIDAWLNRISHNHLSIEGGRDSCCNNHFYRRALHATIIGILTADDTLFRLGVSAIYSAIFEMNEEASLPREIARGQLAAHYQNYAVLYLVFIAELIERQGYPAFNLEIEGKTLMAAIMRALDITENPEILNKPGDPEQDLHFMEDGQYFSWGEVVLARHFDQRLETLIEPFRPVYNRSAGGYVTLYFYQPEGIELTE